MARGLAPDTAKSARQVSRLASVTTLCQAALERQPRKLPPREHEAGTLLLVANKRRQFFEQFVALVHVAEVRTLTSILTLTLALTLTRTPNPNPNPSPG